MSQETAPLSLVGNHRLNLDLRIDDDADRFDISPKAADPRIFLGAAIIVFGIWCSGLAIIFLGSGFSDRVSLVIWGVFGLPIMLGVVAVIRFAAHQEFERGPVLQYRRVEGVVSLPHEGTQFVLDEIVGVALVSGPFKFAGETDPEAELSLLIARDGDQPPEAVPVLMRSDIREMETLAERVAAALECPLRRERIEPGMRPLIDRARRRFGKKDREVGD